MRGWIVGFICLLIGLAVMGSDRLLTRGITYGTNIPPVAHLPEHPYGVNVELDKIVDQAKLQRSVRMIADAGFRYIRQV
ncbi:MAG: hypothetical protein KGJ86_21195, partial [Chloroflexota bacterium]|nr:hypothetical protein [Chloroflexota bacterium]